MREKVCAFLQEIIVGLRKILINGLLIISGVCIIGTLIFSCSNYTVINNGIKLITEEIQHSCDSIKVILKDINAALNANTNRNSKDNFVENLTEEVDKFQVYIMQFNELKKGIWDSNTITFLCSFFLVFLVSALLARENRANELLERSEKLEKKIKDEYGNTKKLIEVGMKVDYPLFNQVLALLWMAMNLWNDFFTNKKKIVESTRMILNELVRISKELTDWLDSTNYVLISKSSLEFNRKNLKEVMSIIERIEDTPNNQEIKENKSNKNLREIGATNSTKGMFNTPFSFIMKLATYLSSIFNKEKLEKFDRNEETEEIEEVEIKEIETIKNNIEAILTYLDRMQVIE